MRKIRGERSACAVEPITERVGVFEVLAEVEGRQIEVTRTCGMRWVLCRWVRAVVRVWREVILVSERSLCDVSGRARIDHS